MFKFINLKIFFIVFAIGLFVNYIRSSAKTIIYKFPNQANDIIYNTNNDNICFKFNRKQVDCDEKSYDIPIIENFN